MSWSRPSAWDKGFYRGHCTGLKRVGCVWEDVFLGAFLEGPPKQRIQIRHIGRVGHGRAYRTPSCGLVCCIWIDQRTLLSSGHDQLDRALKKEAQKFARQVGVLEAHVFLEWLPLKSYSKRPPKTPSLRPTPTHKIEKTHAVSRRQNPKF